MQTYLAIISRCRLTAFSIVFVSVMALFLSACGGGGGGSSSGANPGPSNVQTVGGDGAVTLTWNPVSGATAYNIYLAKQAGVTKSNYLTLNGGEKRTVLTSPAIVGALANGTTYFLVVNSINAASKESDSSAEVSTTPLPAPPLAPQNVQAQTGDKRVTLSWDNMTGANSYNVYYGTQSGVTKFSGIKLSNQNNPALISNLTNGVTYYFVVTSSNTTYSQESSDSGVAHATPAILPGDTAPLTGSATSVTDTSANLNGNFTNPPGFTTTVSFEYGSTSSFGNSTASDVYLQSGSISYSKAVTTLSPMTTLHYRLVTQNSGGTYYGQDQQFTTSAAPTTLLSDLDAPVGMLFDGSYVYWMEVYSGRVRRLNVTNDITSTIASNMAFGGNSGGVAIDGTYFYLTDGWGAIRRMNLDGSNLQNNFSTAAMSSPTQIVAHSTGLYIREDWCDTANMLLHQTISRISLDGLSRTQLYERPGNVPGIPGVGGCGGSGFGGGMVLDNNYLYWTDYYYGNIQRLPLSGGTPVIVATSLFYPDQLLLNGTMLYVSHANGISRIDLSMGTMTSVISTPGVSGGSMVKDGTNLYVLTPTRVSKLDLNTDASITISIADQGYTSVPVVTSNHLYWITAGNHYYPPLGALKQIMKP